MRKESDAVVLPQSASDFRKVEYWNSFYDKVGGDFEWYGSTDDIKELLDYHPFDNVEGDITEGDNILYTPDMTCVQVGCGNSTLHVLLESKFKKVLSVDYSPIAINQQKRLYPNSNFRILDISKEKIPQADVIIDKAFMDSYLSMSTGEKKVVELENTVKKETQSRCDSYINGLLESASKYSIICTLGEKQIIGMLIKSLRKLEAENQVFANIAVVPYSVKSMSNNILETKMMLQPMALYLSKSKTKQSSVNIIAPKDFDVIFPKTKNSYKVIELLSICKNIHLTRCVLEEERTIKRGERRLIKLNNTNDNTIPYEVYIYDNEDDNIIVGCNSKVPPVNVVMVPSDMLYDPTFCTEEHNQAMCNQLNCDRLITVFRTDGKAQTVVDLNKYLSTLLNIFKMNHNDNVPVLAPESESDARFFLDMKLVVEKDFGNYKVSIFDDVWETDKKGVSLILRKMVFSNRPRQIQSALFYKTEKTPTVLPLYHKLEAGYITDIISTVHAKIQKEEEKFVLSNKSPDIKEQNKPLKCLVLGSGCGAISCGLVNILNNYNITVLDIDRNKGIIDLSKQFMHYKNNTMIDFDEDEHLIIDNAYFQKKKNIIVREADGLEIVKEKMITDQLFDCIIVDINEEDPYSIISAPSKGFMTVDFFKSLKRILSQDNTGLLIYNFISRSNEAAEQFKNNAQKVFKNVTIQPVEDEVNKLVIMHDK